MSPSRLQHWVYIAQLPLLKPLCMRNCAACVRLLASCFTGGLLAMTWSLFWLPHACLGPSWRYYMHCQVAHDGGGGKLCLPLSRLLSEFACLSLQ